MAKYTPLVITHTCSVVNMGQRVLQLMHHGQGDELHPHGLHRGHAPAAAPTSWRTMDTQEWRMVTGMVAGLLEDTDLPNADTGCQSVNDEIQRH